MTTLNEKIQQGFERVVALLKQVRDDLQGKVGTLAQLSTTHKSSLVGALNELKGAIDGFSQIDDAGAASASKIWSSQKTKAVIDGAIAALINGAGTDGDTLKELADKITALAQADTGLVSTSAQSFTEPQKAQARTNIGAVASADLGDIASADFVMAVNSAYNAA